MTSATGGTSATWRKPASEHANLVVEGMTEVGDVTHVARPKTVFKTDRGEGTSDRPSPRLHRTPSDIDLPNVLYDGPVAQDSPSFFLAEFGKNIGNFSFSSAATQVTQANAPRASGAYRLSLALMTGSSPIPSFPTYGHASPALPSLPVSVEDSSQGEAVSIAQASSSLGSPMPAGLQKRQACLAIPSSNTALSSACPALLIKIVPTIFREIRKPQLVHSGGFAKRTAIFKSSFTDPSLEETLKQSLDSHLFASNSRITITLSLSSGFSFRDANP
ncbi:hypothetical protein C8R46DRAFT_1213105 [Mycena filopes]|nr:hypothetical protein C8R46DRAFT_1213105 [Mycena filopes]